MESQSIHPRVVNGRTKYEKVSTAKPRSTGFSAKKFARMQAHFAAHPSDSKTAARLAKASR